MERSEGFFAECLAARKHFPVNCIERFTLPAIQSTKLFVLYLVQGILQLGTRHAVSILNMLSFLK
jgi:hypothetical protein